MTSHSNKVTVVDVPASVRELQLYLEQLKGKKVLTIEETTPAQWLYTELKDYVDELIVCDPRRNHLLNEGAKNDKIDAEKLVKLLRAGLLKPVFHTSDQFIYLRKIVSGYEDVIKALTRLKNQRAALYRANGKDAENDGLEHPAEKFVLGGIDKTIESFEEQRAEYQKEFEKLSRKHRMIKHLLGIPGIGIVGAIKIAAIVVDPRRFKSRGAFLSYCGLIKLDRISGGKSYGTKNPRYCRPLKSVFKIAAFTAAVNPNRKNPLREFYLFLTTEKGLPEYDARHAIARRIAVLVYGVLKSGKKFEFRRPQCNATI
jgi:transposase